MKNIRFHNTFWKLYKKLPLPIQLKTKERIALFASDSFNPILCNHSLAGRFQGSRSINITGDYRAIYTEIDDVYIFKIVGTHSQLYG